MSATQQLLFPDPRPLVERLGRDFFLNLPDSPGVYVMKDADGTPIYVGKAVSLRRRLRSYRVANPDRMTRRHLQLLRLAVEIELIPCADEPSALAREAAMLRTLRPRFNRAGTWPGKPRYLAWKAAGPGLELAVLPDIPGNQRWRHQGPMGRAASHLRNLLARLLWLAAHPEQGSLGVPWGWFEGRIPDVIRVPMRSEAQAEGTEQRLVAWFHGETEPLGTWLREHTANFKPGFERSMLDRHLEEIDAGWQ